MFDFMVLRNVLASVVFLTLKFTDQFWQVNMTCFFFKLEEDLHAVLVIFDQRVDLFFFQARRRSACRFGNNIRSKS